MSSNNEVILAQEQGVLNKIGLIREVEGTLILTNRRLLFVAAQEEQKMVGGIVRLRFTDIDDLAKIPQDESNFSIPLGAISSLRGRKGIITTPSITVKWGEPPEEKSAEFIQKVTGGRKKNLNDWIPVIEKLKSGEEKIEISQLPSKETLEGKIIYCLGDMQDQGVLEIETDVEQEFKVDLDPDAVEAACERLVAQGLLSKIRDASGDNFYRRRSPLGENDLSV